MIYDLTNKLITKFTGDWVDRKSGAVRVVKDGDNRKPYGIVQDGSDCNAKILMSPDESYKSVMYMETDGNISTVPMEGGHSICTASVRLVVWLNGKKLGDNSGNVSHDIIQDIMRQIKSWGSFSLVDYNNVKVSIESIEPKDFTRTFGKYGADEGFRFYVKPHDFLSMRLKITFVPFCTTFSSGDVVC